MKWLFCSLMLIEFIATKAQSLHYAVSFPNASSHEFHVELQVKNFNGNKLVLKMPEWMPGYYQIMSYVKNVKNLKASNGASIRNLNANTWELTPVKGKPISLQYDVVADRKFVANSFVDSSRAYIVTTGAFLYLKDRLDIPVKIAVHKGKKWTSIATGLEPAKDMSDVFVAPNFDILYDCPILIGNLEELPSFKVRGVEHRFIGYAMGDFDKVDFMNKLQKVVEAGVNIIGEIPYKQYTFIGIGPGQGGIEHLNNTTVSFDGKGLNTPGGMNRIMNFLAHEYFHHYNVKRIRPLELGPFNYDKGSRTNLLWVSEGLSVYYEYLMVKRAGLADEATLFSNLEHNINAFENSPGKAFQSLVQASYKTWSDGPFGGQGEDANKSISYYDKGPIVGWLLDLEIRHTTKNEKSLDDVMRYCYYHYYKELGRGFTDAEFQTACEEVAGISLQSFFEYVYTTKELDYDKYLGYAGLKISKSEIESKKLRFQIKKVERASEEQERLLGRWMNE